MDKAVVLNSGGFDSVVLIHYLHEILGEQYLFPIHFLYGAQNENQQLVCARNVCRKFNLHQKEIELPEITWTQNSFYSTVSNSSDERQAQYLEFRNLIFMSYAISYAEGIGAKKVYLALINNSDYPDANLDFLQGLNHISTQRGIEVDAPFIYDPKLRLGHIAEYLGVKEGDYFSCDVPIKGKPCGLCLDCVALKDIRKKVAKRT